MARTLPPSRSPSRRGRLSASSDSGRSSAWASRVKVVSRTDGVGPAPSWRSVRGSARSVRLVLPGSFPAPGVPAGAGHRSWSRYPRSPPFLMASPCGQRTRDGAGCSAGSVPVPHAPRHEDIAFARAAILTLTLPWLAPNGHQFGAVPGCCALSPVMCAVSSRHYGWGRSQEGVGNLEPRGRRGRGSGFPTVLTLFDLCSLFLPGWVLFCGAGVFLTSAPGCGGEVRKTEAERAERHPARPAAVAAVLGGRTGRARAGGWVGGQCAARCEVFVCPGRAGVSPRVTPAKVRSRARSTEGNRHWVQLA